MRPTRYFVRCQKKIRLKRDCVHITISHFSVPCLPPHSNLDSASSFPMTVDLQIILVLPLLRSLRGFFMTAHWAFWYSATSGECTTCPKNCSMLPAAKTNCQCCFPSDHVLS